MLLLVGLGNPGPAYEGTPHNIGFRVIDEIVERHGFEPWRSRFHAMTAKGRLGNSDALALKPMTYMNESGVSVGEASRFFKIPKDSIVVFHDEIDLPAGKVKAKQGGGHAGHNGLRSIDAHIGPDYRRVRIGVGHPGERHRVAHYLTETKFSRNDETWLQPLIDAIIDAAPLLVEGDAAFTNKFALLTKPPRQKKDGGNNPPDA